jgi:hypothetical protein
MKLDLRSTDACKSVKQDHDRLFYLKRFSKSLCTFPVSIVWPCICSRPSLCMNLLGSAEVLAFRTALLLMQNKDLTCLLHWLQRVILHCTTASNPGRPRSSFNDVALRDCQNCRISRPYRDAQDRLLWRDKTCPART